MATSKVNTALWDENGTLHLINEGDELPEWAEVGKHVTDGVDDPDRIDTDIDRAVETTARGTMTTIESTPKTLGTQGQPDFTGGAAETAPATEEKIQAAVDNSKLQAKGSTAPKKN